MMKKSDPSFEWKIPIAFYGRVVDENGRPVAAAKIRFQWTDMSERGISESFSETDSRGFFSLVGVRGKRLGVWVTKDGYHSEGGLGGRSFEYAAFFEGNYHRPSEADRVVFRLTQKLGAEALITHHVSERVPYDKTIYYDLERGTLTQQSPSGSALRLTAARSEASQGEPFDWKLRIEMTNGGIQQTAEEFAQVAPEAGYLPLWEVSRSARAEYFEAGAHAKLYLHRADNRYARLDLELTNPNARDLGPRLKIESYLNPTPGSRNLEFDPKKQIKAPP